MEYNREALERELDAYEKQGKTGRAAQVRKLLGKPEAAARVAPENTAAPKPAKRS